ncbi:hypothetical protein HDE_05963 [Halotydeus destructor]|nr:hypothetical protein HDE_05963 [Halotydeus destructor]
MFSETTHQPAKRSAGNHFDDYIFSKIFRFAVKDVKIIRKDESEKESTIVRSKEELAMLVVLAELKDSEKLMESLMQSIGHQDFILL